MAYDTISVIVFFVVGAALLLRILLFAVRFIRKIRDLWRSFSSVIRSLRKKKKKGIPKKPDNVIVFDTCRSDSSGSPDPAAPDPVDLPEDLPNIT